MARDDDVGRVRDAIEVPPLPLEWKLKGLGRRRVKARHVRLGNDQRWYSVRFRHGTRSIYLCDTLLRSRRRS